MSIVWKRKDILSDYSELINYSEIEKIRAQNAANLLRPYWTGLRETLESLPLGADIIKRRGQLAINVNSKTVTIGEADDLSLEEQKILSIAIKSLVPWRKGPFNLFGQEIDAEWQSNMKWDRVLPQLPDLANKKVLDIGCGNGYYMFRASQQKPECLLGIDPSCAFYYSFELLQRFIQNPKLQYDLLRIEDINLFPEFFDVILCMGVIYHQRNPMLAINQLASALTVGGELIIESQAIDEKEPLSLFVPTRYAKAHNVYFIPSPSCLAAWLKKSGFKNIEICSMIKLSCEEQRKTELSPFESLQDFLNPQDNSKTIEGYPAPYRVIVRAIKAC